MIDYLMNDAVRESVQRGLDNSFKVPENCNAAYLASFLICDAIREARRRGREYGFKVDDIGDKK